MANNITTTFFNNIRLNDLTIENELEIEFMVRGVSLGLALGNHYEQSGNADRYISAVYRWVKNLDKILYTITPDANRVIIDSKSLIVLLAEQKYDWNGKTITNEPIEHLFNHRYDLIAALFATYELMKESLKAYVELLLDVDCTNFRQTFAKKPNAINMLQRLLFVDDHESLRPSDIPKLEPDIKHNRYFALLSHLIINSRKIADMFTIFEPNECSEFNREAGMAIRVIAENWIDSNGVPLPNMYTGVTDDFFLFVLGYTSTGEEES